MRGRDLRVEQCGAVIDPAVVTKLLAVIGRDGDYQLA